MVPNLSSVECAESEPSRIHVVHPSASPDFNHSFVTISMDAVSAIMDDRASDSVFQTRKEVLDRDADTGNGENILRNIPHVFQRA
jgi:hypothetical protein